MIYIDHFGQQKTLVSSALDNINQQISHAVGAPVKMVLQTDVNEETLTRMHELEKGIFAIENKYYSKQDILHSRSRPQAVMHNHTD